MTHLAQVAHLVVAFFTASAFGIHRSSKSAFSKQFAGISKQSGRIYHRFIMDLWWISSWIYQTYLTQPSESLKLSNWEPDGIHSHLEWCSSVDIHFLCWHCHKSHCELQSKNGLCCKALFASLLVNSPGRSQKCQDKTQPGSFLQNDWLDHRRLSNTSVSVIKKRYYMTTWYASINMMNFHNKSRNIPHSGHTVLHCRVFLWHEMLEVARQSSAISKTLPPKRSDKHQEKYLWQTKKHC